MDESLKPKSLEGNMNPEQIEELRAIGRAFVEYCQKGSLLDRREHFQVELRKNPQLAEAVVEAIYRDANLGSNSRTFFDDWRKTRARVNYWRVQLKETSSILPEPKSPSQFSDQDMDIIFESGKVSPQTLREFLPVILKQTQEQGQWEAVIKQKS